MCCTWRDSSGCVCSKSSGSVSHTESESSGSVSGTGSDTDAVNDDTIKHYFDLLNDVMTEFDIHSKSSQIYNVDESGIRLFDLHAPNIVTTKEIKKVRYRQSGRKGQVTIVGCASASGHAFLPMVIFDAKRLNPEWTIGEFQELSMVLVTMVY